LPGDVIGRADVDAVVGEPHVELRLHGLGLGNLLRLEARLLEHVEEVGVPACIQLIGAVQLHAAVAHQARQNAMHDRRAELALDVVADDREPVILEAACPPGIRRDEYRTQFTIATPASRQALA
jgi:hypothetical protein